MSVSQLYSQSFHISIRVHQEGKASQLKPKTQVEEVELREKLCQEASEEQEDQKVEDKEDNQIEAYIKNLKDAGDN